MTKVINFTAIEILPSLLNKSKTQTIRLVKSDKPRFKINQSISLYWNQRSKYSYFCRKCGSAFSTEKSYGDYGTCKCGTKIEGRYIANHVIAETLKYSVCFDKLLGTGTITEVFKIEMWTGNDVPLVTGYSRKQSEELAKMDGFKDYKSFFEYFSQKGLSKPKQFWVYRWKWDK